MATIKQFEDISAWQDAREFCKWVFNVIISTDLSTDYKLRSQIDGAAGSIMDNIAEGFERGGDGEFKNFLSYAKGSAGECRSQWYRLFDRGYIKESQLKERKKDLNRISSRIQIFMYYLQKSDMKGWKFKEPPEDYGI